MDPRHSALPYASNTPNNASRQSFPPAPAPPAAPHPHHHHQPLDSRGPPSVPYATHPRRPPDSSYQPAAATRPYSYDQPPPTHSRAHSLPSVRDRDLGRTMPPPNSPPQPGPHHSQHPHSQQQPSHAMPPYGSGPPPPRAPPLTVGPPSSFPPGRELPSLSSIARTGPVGGSMSISSMLGGPPSASRDPQQPQHQYPPHSGAPPGSAPGFAPPSHASPRMPSASTDFSPFRRPQTPDHQRPYDPRASAAPSPRGPYSTPEVPRYGTPQTYHARHMSASADPSGGPGRMSVSAAPPRPSSQPKAYPGMPPRPMESRAPGPDDRYGRRDEMGRPMPGHEYNPERTGLRPYSYDDRYRAERERQNEMEQREQERREYERRERAYSGSDSGRHPLHPHDLGHREPPRNQPPFGRPEARDPRDAHWGRPGSDPNFRAPMDHQRQHPEYPPHTSAAYPTHGTPYHGSPERFPPASLPAHSQTHPTAPPPQPFESPDRARAGLPHPPPQHQQPPHQLHGPRGRPGEEVPSVPPSIAFNSGSGGPAYDALRHRNSDDASAPLGHQRNLLAIQQEHRKGRISPLPQAVQGVQPQQPGPAAEPGIKSEFGRMFSGIGSGVGAMGGSSPITSAAGPFTNAALAKRDDIEGPDSGPDAAGKGAKGRRRKLKDEDSREDSGSGRLTPGHKAKRPKGHQHHHHQ